MIVAFIFGSAFLIAYVLVVAVSPLHRCPRCNGEGIVATQRSFKPCLKCNGRGKAYRFGAPLVHRLIDEHIGSRLRERIRPVQEDTGELSGWRAEIERKLRENQQ